ncbi:Phage integrase family protein [Streptomyces zhaozhouensis]|uniref:Phage integrase family protein n=1 Tax=Streptomyces zhaozhouensis TaxID=1300267 RepID=A0A286DQE7_9ACTN|nr:site-specific integrase [Streptomyces zhaozhouensis]SOD60907.1 Phage integrase family protein [Streptomyces zhaozhouensis]
MKIMAESITPERCDALLADDSIPVLHRALWQLLWETDIRVLDLLSLDVREVDLAGGRIVRTGTGSTAGPVALGARSLALLAPLMADRATGPLFGAGNERLRALSWEEAVRGAQEHGQAIHAFRTAGKRHREGA